MRCMSRIDARRAASAVAVCAAVLVANRASGDALLPPPSSCPPGLQPYSSQGGTGCAPPLPDDCPDGYKPGTWGPVAYCDPPHASACPAGSWETSAGPDQPACSLGVRCEDAHDCAPAKTCRPTGLCIDPSALPDREPRFANPWAYGVCRTDDDCLDGRVCDHSRRCDPDVHRVDPEGRQLPALIRVTQTAEPWGWETRSVLAAALAALCILGVTFVLMLHRRRTTRGSTD